MTLTTVRKVFDNYTSLWTKTEHYEQKQKKDEEEPTLVTESILAEILAEAERVVQPNVPYKVMNQELPIVKPIKAVTSEERSRYENTASCKFLAKVF